MSSSEKESTDTKEKVMTYVFLDLEATGVAGIGERPKITELTIVAVHREELINAYKFKVFPRILNKLTVCVDPKKMITPKAMELTGLYNDSLGTQSAFDKDTTDMVSLFLRRLQQPVCLLAHNGDNFDFPLLRTESMKHGGLNLPNLMCADTLKMMRSVDSAMDNGPQDITNNNTGDNIKSDLMAVVDDKNNTGSNSGSKSLNSAILCQHNKQHTKGLTSHVVIVNSKSPKDGDLTMQNHEKDLLKELFPSSKTPESDAVKSVKVPGKPLKRKSVIIQECLGQFGDNVVTKRRLFDKKLRAQNKQDSEMMSDGSDKSDLSDCSDSCTRCENRENPISSNQSGQNKNPLHNLQAHTTILYWQDYFNEEFFREALEEDLKYDKRSDKSDEVTSTSGDDKLDQQSGGSSPASCDDDAASPSPKTLKDDNTLCDGNASRKENATCDHSRRQHSNRSKNLKLDNLTGKLLNSRFNNIPVLVVPRPGNVSYSLTEIYKRMFGRYPLAAHRAEDDCIALLQIVQQLAPDACQWIDANASNFNSTKPLYKPR